MSFKSIIEKVWSDSRNILFIAGGFAVLAILSSAIRCDGHFIEMLLIGAFEALITIVGLFFSFCAAVYFDQHTKTENSTVSFLIKMAVILSIPVIFYNLSVYFLSCFRNIRYIFHICEIDF